MHKNIESEARQKQPQLNSTARLYIIQSNTINASSYYLGTYRQIDAAFIVELSHLSSSS